MKKLIVYNAETSGLTVAVNASEVLRQCSVESELLEFSSIMNPVGLSEKLLSDVDTVIAIGGDGTIIKVAKIAALHNIPVLGINAGHLGYLASVNVDQLDMLKRLVTGGYSIENRILIKAEKYKNGVCIGSCDCLNDAVITKNSLANIIDISVTIGNDTINYRADGIIASTPTGSTAYSMSAGGPVVDPSLDCIVITPVCPHTLLNRSLVVDGSTPVTVAVNSKYDTEIILSCDGQAAFELDRDSIVKISVSPIVAKFIKLNDSSVYKVFFDKTNHC